ncbi:hypothetical protein KFK09_027203 [Dendrobium nobile]|uniref:DUF1421 domain-containing protein n=1 Tax=Dendrobium nobile TaxID=94219 RepID=A0A8T3A912_DENNO|nr:hypothetical protein KFK09_027203 [Dendrobium nobile]
MDCGGSSVQAAAGPRLFDFGSDDVLCSFEEYALRLEPTGNGKLLDSSAKNLHGNRLRSPSANAYGQPEEFSREDVIYAVEKCMKKYADNLTMQLEGISGRLTQLELYCYKLDRSIGEFRADMTRDQIEADLKLNSLGKHVHEVRRSVQIIRDNQDLSKAQKELTKLLLPQKDSSNLSHSQKKDKGLNYVISENKANYESNDVPIQPLALTLPYQISSPPTSIAIRAPDKNHPEKELPVLPRDHYILNQANGYYYTHNQPLLVEQQSQNLQPELHYAQQKQESIVAANQPTQQSLFTQYQPHWSQPMQPQPPSSQAQSPRLETPPAYAPYHPNQHQRNMQQEPLPQASQGSFAPPPPLAKNGYVGTSTYPSQSNMLGYDAVYVIDGSRTSYPQSYHLGSYPPNGNATALLTSCSYPNGNMVEKAINMGYPRDQMVGVVFGTAESG